MELMDEATQENESVKPRIGPLKICQNPRCGFSTNELVSKCPQCKRPIWTVSEFRLISTVLLPCGLFFIAVGGMLFIATFRIGGQAIKGGVPVWAFLLSLFGFLFTMGLAILLVGAWQVIFARVNIALLYILLKFLLIFGALVLFGRTILWVIAG